MKYLNIILAILLLSTVSCKADDQSLFEDMRSIASSGNPEAQYHLGMFYNNGIGTSKDIKKAFEAFQKSSDGGDPLGSYKVGCYYSGQGEGVVEGNQNKALKYKLVAAKAGYVRAQQDVAEHYFRNNDFKEAILWWEKAASQGYPSAFYSLFSMYYDKKYNSKDWAKAYQYLLIIDRNIGEDQKQEVAQKIEEIKATLSEEQIAQAQKFAENFNPSKTELTIKAFAGKTESIELVKKYKEGKL